MVATTVDILDRASMVGGPSVQSHVPHLALSAPDFGRYSHCASSWVLDFQNFEILLLADRMCDCGPVDLALPTLILP